MWTYDAQHNTRTNPKYQRANQDGTPSTEHPYPFVGEHIDTDMVFDEVRITCDAERLHIGPAYVYSGGDQVSQVAGQEHAWHRSSAFAYLDDEPEVLEIRRRIKAGTCRVTYYDPYDFNPPVEEDSIHATHWLLQLMHPFHADDRHLFFEHFTRDLAYTPATEDGEQVFRVPGIWRDASAADTAPVAITYYKRDDSPTAPDVRAVAEIAGEGWTVDPPYGPHRLHTIRGTDTPDGVIVSHPERAYRRRPDQTAAIVAVARAWDRYWRGLTSAEQGINVRMTARKHFEHAIGRAWADKPFDGDIRVFYEGEALSKTRPERDAEDWMLGNLEQWAHDWGFPAFALAINSSGNRSALESQLGDYTFCHVNADGTVGDRLNNGADGITEATWDAYQDTHYSAAVRHGVDTLAVESLTIIVHQGTTETAQLVVTGGLAPLAYEVTATVPIANWASIDAATGEVTVAPDAAVTAQEYVVRVKVSDDLGTEVYRDVIVTVRAAE